MSDENGFWTLLGQQHGLITAWQAASFGISKDQIHRWIKKGRLRRVAYGILATPGASSTRESKLMLGILMAGPRRPDNGIRAALCDLSAAELHDLVEPDPSEPIHVMSTRRIQKVEPGYVFHWTSRLPEKEIELVSGMAITDPVRTFLDICGTNPHRALSVYRRGLRKGRFSRDIVVDRVEWESRQGREGLVRARHVVAVTDPSAPEARSWLEDHFFDLLVSMGYPPPLRNVMLAGSYGFRWQIDLYYPSERKGLEISPVETHSDPEVVMKDQRKLMDLAAQGITIVPIGSDITDEEFCAAMRRLLGPPENLLRVEARA